MPTKRASAHVLLLKLALLAVPLLGWAWLSCMLIHELGHVLGAWATGGRLVLVDVRPFVFSTTLVEPNPMPGVVLWSGFLMGWLVALFAIPLGRVSIHLFGPISKAWSAYCWLAMGSYQALSMGERFSDTGLLLKLGWSPIVLGCVGGVVAVAGYVVGKQAMEQLAVQIKQDGISARAIVVAWTLFLVWWLGQSSLASSLEFQLVTRGYAALAGLVKLGSVHAGGQLTWYDVGTNFVRRL